MRNSGGGGTPPKTLTIYTQMCDFPYPVYDQTLKSGSGLTGLTGLVLYYGKPNKADLQNVYVMLPL